MNSRVADLRSRSRRALRTAQRVYAGGRELGPSATIRWSATRWAARGHADERQLTENSSFTWVISRPDTTTNVWLHNYWSDAYGIDQPQIRAALTSESGETLKSWQHVLQADCTEVIDIRSLIRGMNLPVVFDGQLLLEMAHERLVPGRPLQVFAEYIRDDGEATGVHGQYGLMKKPTAQLVGTMRVDTSGSQRTAVVLTNPYDGPNSPKRIRPQLQLISGDGTRRRSVSVADIPARGSRTIWIDEAFPELQKVLRGTAGHFRVQMPCPSSRIATFAEFPDGTRVANHGTVDRVFDQGFGMPATWTKSRSVCSAVTFCGPEKETVLEFANHWGPILATCDVEVRLFHDNGLEAARHVVTVRPDEFRQLAVREIYELHHVEPLPVAHAEIRVSPAEDVIEWPAYFDVLVAQKVADQIVAEVQVGGDFVNGPVPPGVGQPDIRRTRTFARVKVGPDTRTRIFLAHPSSSPDWDAVAQPVLKLLDTSGRFCGEWTSEPLHPHGWFLADVAEIFPEAASRLAGDGVGVVRVRDLNARLYGYYLTEHSGASTFPMCHLIGG